MERTFVNEMGYEVILKQWSDGRWFIDMGCQLWNRVYQSENMALNFLAKNGWKEKDAKKVTVIYLGEEVEMEREAAELFVRYNKDASIK
jgi:hypothetical protein